MQGKERKKKRKAIYVPCQGGTTVTRGSGYRDFNNVKLVTLVDPGLVMKVIGNEVFTYSVYVVSMLIENIRSEVRQEPPAGFCIHGDEPAGPKVTGNLAREALIIISKYIPYYRVS
jgi:hypothetical protein